LKQKIRNKYEYTRHFSKGQQLPNGWFTGNVYDFPLVAKDINNEFSVGVITFETGARTN